MMGVEGLIDRGYLHDQLMASNPDYRAAINKLKPRTRLDRDAEEHRLRLYLRDHMERARSNPIAIHKRLMATDPDYAARAMCPEGRNCAAEKHCCREYLNGRTQAIPAEPTRPAGADAHGRREAEPKAQADGPGSHGVYGDRDHWHWAC